jgi:ribonuclease E
VNAAVREALKPRVDLPSGGYIIIEPTEALTVIDVNSGSFTRSATARETVLWTNSEAATEIARQLRLRNIGGVIVVDFIDMDSSKDQLKLLEHFNKALKADKARPQIAQLSALGLVELTRKRQGQNIYELFGQTCSHCGGLGHLARLPGEGEAIILEVPTALPTVASKTPGEKPLLVPPVEVSESLFEGGGEFESEENGQGMDYALPEASNGPRRRRRRRSTDLVLKDDSGTKLNGAETEADYEPPRSEEKRERSPRPSRREEVPVERIAVEMTPLEQDVYSLMGISPLVLINKEVKDPRSVIVSVKTTNESHRWSGEEAAWEAEESQEPLTVVTPPPPTEPFVLQPVASEVIFPAEPPPSEPPAMATVELSEVESERPIIRRRRRRSSAQEN